MAAALFYLISSVVEYIGAICLLTLTTLASGSSGNCLLVSCGATHLLVDVGISARRITRSLRELGLEPDQLSGVLITHEHTDHIAGLATLSRQYDFPVYASHGTGRQLCYRLAALEDRLRPFEPGVSFPVGDLEVASFPTLHDTPYSVGYSLTDGRHRAAVVTDLGLVTQDVLEGISGCHLLVAESNHDEDWVRSGPYPYPLKQRILGDHGHLSNEAGGQLVCSAVAAGAVQVVLAHLSSENNTPARAYGTVSAALEGAGAVVGADLTLAVAPRSEIGPTYRVGQPALAPTPS